MRQVVADPITSRAGVAFGVTAYGLWGVFPLLFRLLRSVTAIEILLHRVVWSFVVVVAVLALSGSAPPGRRGSVSCAATPPGCCGWLRPGCWWP